MVDIRKKLSFNYAKHHGVFIDQLRENTAELISRAEIDSVTLAEVRRHLNVPIQLKVISKEEFERQLARVYETDTSSAMELVMGMEEGIDFAQLMEQMPKTEELLDTEGDAPIIRLINAIFTQAIKQKASDI